MGLEDGPVGQLLLELERGSGAPLHVQLESALRAQVRSGRLAPETKLPSSRALAASLGISRGVVVEAYSQLVAEGYLIATQGAPTRVAGAADVERSPVPARSLEPQHVYDFMPGVPDLSAFPSDRWLRSLRAALRETPYRALGREDPRGMVRLRNALMAYLGRVRGAAPEPEHTLVCAGFTQGFALLCRTLSDRGIERVALEEPGSAQHRLIAERCGLSPVGVPVDGEGLDVDALAGCGCEVVVVTPAHQFPTGVVLSSGRRAELLEWAEEVDGLIVEDDYDSELRYDRDPVGALQGLAPERVCHIGSASQRLAPALRLGWVLSPSWLTGALTYEKALADGGTAGVDQLALAEFIERGELDRHLRRMRLRYRSRREALVDALATALPGALIRGAAAGLHTLVILPDGSDENALVREAARRQVGVVGLAGHYGGGGAEPAAGRAGGRAGGPAAPAGGAGGGASPAAGLAAGAGPSPAAGLTARAGNSPPPPGLVLGYGNLPEPAIRRGVALLAEAAGT